MSETRTQDEATLEDGGTMEIVRIPAWEVKYALGSTPDEVAHVVCCRDLDWRRAFCGYEEPDPVIVPEMTTLCTMCVEAMGRVPGPGQCPVDDQPCPDDDTIDRMIAERTSRP